MSNKPFNPRSTTFTNLMLDVIMPSLSPNAWKVICFAMRKTAGWADLSTESGRKESDVISISQFRSGCGIASNDTVTSALEECLGRGYLIRERSGRSFSYRLNVDYEIPGVTESVNSRITETVIDIVTETVNTNSKLNTKKDSLAPQQKLQPSPSSPAMETLAMTTTEEYKKRTEDALFASMTKNTSDYTHYSHYPEDVRQVVKITAELWHFKPPDKPHNKSERSQYARWIQDSRNLLDACAEFGPLLLVDLNVDWEAYKQSRGGVAPFTVSGPGSLVKIALSKAANLRGGNHASLWADSRKPTQAAHQTTLDV